jgi:hypothetical protein
MRRCGFSVRAAGPQLLDSEGWNGFAGSPGETTADGGEVMDAAGLEILAPALMGCTLLWWAGPGMSWTARFAVSAITVVLIIAVLLLGRVGI